MDGEKNKGYYAFGDRRIAVCEEVKAAIIEAGRIDPDTRRTAPDERRIGLQDIGHRFKRPAQIDQQAVSIICVEKFIFVLDIGEAGHGRAASRRGP